MSAVRAVRAGTVGAALLLAVAGCTASATKPPVAKSQHTLQLGGQLAAVATIPATDLAYVLNRTDVDVVDLPRARLQNRIGLGETGIALVASPDGRRMYVVANRQQAQGGSVYAIDRISEKIVRRLGFAGALQAQITVSADGGHVYVSDPSHRYDINTNDLQIAKSTTRPQPAPTEKLEEATTSDGHFLIQIQGLSAVLIIDQ